ncbi:hypothetical protein DTL42_23390 [Bremerella cremea]|uniref:DUF4157 domain-containing protein n=1 Tax=Bremerella cremea TaxID=1031537 RepID=A0A368KL50_9BACT|nr:hypothetical protein [Bremerella cremea]RCS41498.1 hypothetical protein DTL42_23390 [Bremerella cremea]
MARSFTIFLTGWLLLANLSWANAQEPPSVRLSEKTSLIFEPASKGKALIGKEDDFLDRVGDLEMQVRLQSEKPVTKQAYIESLQAGVEDWQPQDIKFVVEATQRVRERLQGYDLPFPPQIHLIRVSEEVEGNAPHCREASIVLPDAFFADPNRATGILAHELFHVLSSHNPELRDKLYKIIHFQPSDEIELPPGLKPQRITNPDATHNEHVLFLDIDGEKTPVVPVILTRSAEYSPGGLFANLDFKLMVLQEQDGKFTAKLVEGRPQLLSPREVPDYMQQIGSNTRYVIHPEEALADNFMLLVLGAKDVPDPWVLDEMKKVLPRKQPAQTNEPQ